MLDLDALAEDRALSLNQPSETWRKAVWSSGFQNLTQNMSDGEVEALIALCPSVAHLDNVVKLLGDRVLSSGKTPFTVLTEEAARAGLTAEDWVRKSLATGIAL